MSGSEEHYQYCFYTNDVIQQQKVSSHQMNTLTYKTEVAKWGLPEYGVYKPQSCDYSGPNTRN